MTAKKMTLSRYEIYVEAAWNESVKCAGWCVKVIDTKTGNLMTIAEPVQAGWCVKAIETKAGSLMSVVEPIQGKEEQAILLQRATLIGLRKVLDWLKGGRERVPEDESVALYISCGYVRKVLLRKWYHTWEHSGWKTVQGKDIPEAERWKKVLELLECFYVMPIQKAHGKKILRLHLLVWKWQSRNAALSVHFGVLKKAAERNAYEDTIC